ncbi:MAG: hypothetical protein K5673_07260 [Lachnospiraceae bacterium]|nr:hypothetical protein [Lachnospiraceae bacterium]
MKTVWQINMDFQKAMAAVERLNAIASGLESNADNLGTTIDSIDRNWDGENSEAYIVKGRKVQNNISLTAGGIRQVAATVEAIAIRTRDAELAAISIAED